MCRAYLCVRAWKARIYGLRDFYYIENSGSIESYSYTHTIKPSLQCLHILYYHRSSFAPCRGWMCCVAPGSKCDVVVEALRVPKCPSWESGCQNWLAGDRSHKQIGLYSNLSLPVDVVTASSTQLSDVVMCTFLDFNLSALGGRECGQGSLHWLHKLR